MVFSGWDETSMKQFIKHFIPASILRFRLHRRMIRWAASNEVILRYGRENIELSKQDKILRLGYPQEMYLHECVLCFDYFFDSVKPLKWRGKWLADFRGPR